MATAAKARPKKAGELDKLDQLSALAAKNKALEDEARAKSGSSNSFITLVQGTTGILKPDDKAYIKGAKQYDYVISKHKLNLGAELDVTVLGIFSLYKELEKRRNPSDQAKTVAFWMPDDAVQIPLAPGRNFERLLPNGNTLVSTHWAFVYLHEHPDIEDAVIAFASLGNRVYTELAKTVRNSSELCTELRFTVTKQPIQSKDHGVYYYPKFDIAGRNYTYANGKVSAVKGGLGKDELAEVLRRSGEAQESYASMQMVARRDLAPYLGTAPRAALPDASDDDGEDITF